MDINLFYPTERSIRYYGGRHISKFGRNSIMNPANTDNSMVLPTMVKNKVLVERRRQQIIDASVVLFIENGFHKTTTRQIAKASGISTGLLYEYIASKEDVLCLVCNSIHEEIENKVGEAVSSIRKNGDGFDEIVSEYFRVCHQMQDRILLIYQEIKSLPKKWQKMIINNEIKVTSIFKNAIIELVELGIMPFVKSKDLDLITHNIVILGHMWTFRRWFLAANYSIEEYIVLQTKNILGMYYNASNKN